jgi:hypothetical protein
MKAIDPYASECAGISEKAVGSTKELTADG